MESVKSLFGGKSKDFITAVDEKSIIIVKELEEGERLCEMDKLAHTIWILLDLNKDGEEMSIWHTVRSSRTERSFTFL